MRRLTLIVSDLYLPAEPIAASEQSGFVELPNFQWLLRYARARAARDWRRALAAHAGPLSEEPPAHFAARGQVPGERVAASWFATPVHLEARLDHVRMSRQGLLRLPADERRAWCEEFARAFGPELTLHEEGSRGFFLSGLKTPQVSSTDPARVLGTDIAASLPRGEHVAPLRRLSAEIEMWLHGAALNRERERARLPRISSLWIWGGGTVAPQREVPQQPADYFGEDPWLRAWARAHSGREARATPARFAGLGAGDGHSIVELTPMSEGEAGLARLDAEWFGPARAALAGGVFDALEVLVNDRQFTTHRHAAWRFWRRDRHWMDLLRRPLPAAQA